VTANTVKFHMKNLYSKLAVNNRVKLITTAIHLGLV
jgi:LuxR family maltose regulon positive regulatory protein